MDSNNKQDNSPHFTEEEINLIVEKVCDNLEKKLYLNVGVGVFGLVWKGIIIGIIAVAAYGFGMSFHK